MQTKTCVSTLCEKWFSIIDFVKKSKGRQITLFGAVDKINYYGKAGFAPASLWLVMEKSAGLPKYKQRR